VQRCCFCDNTVFAAVLVLPLCVAALFVRLL
jgi:hypothetical protein